MTDSKEWCDGDWRWRSSSKPFAGAESGSPGRALEAGKRGSPGRAVQAGIRGKRLNTTKIRISCAKIILQSNSLNSGRFLYNSGRPADHAPFLETPGNSRRLARSVTVSE